LSHDINAGERGVKVHMSYRPICKCEYK